MSLLLRRAVAADVPAACNVVRSSIVQLCGADHQGDESTIAAWLANKTHDNFASWIASPRHVGIVAERAGSVVGFAFLNGAGTIALLYVAPECRFTGVSKAMLASLEEHAVALGMAELKLESTATALAFYERCGYSRAGETVQSFGALRAYPLSKRLAP